MPARWLVVLWVVPYFYLPGYSALYEFIAKTFASGDPNLYWWDIVYYVYCAVLFAVLITVLINRHDIPFKRLFRPIDKRVLLPSVEITAFNFVLSTGLIYLLFLPLSYWAPSFVQAWYIDLPSVVTLEETGYPLLPNFFSLLTLVVLAPLVEETVFRGLLFHRWASKYSVYQSTLLSAAIFAALHTDPPGAFVFAICMSYLYVRSKTLWLPILCHSLYNLCVWLLNFVDTLYQGPGYVYSLADFQDEWIWGLAGLLIAAVWWLRLSPRIPSISSWSVPELNR